MEIMTMNQTYENVWENAEELPSETNELIILGKTHHDKEKAKDDFQSRYWFTYRKLFDFNYS
jgi:hypothetical protein